MCVCAIVWLWACSVCVNICMNLWIVFSVNTCARNFFPFRVKAYLSQQTTGLASSGCLASTSRCLFLCVESRDETRRGQQLLARWRQQSYLRPRRLWRHRPCSRVGSRGGAVSLGVVLFTAMMALKMEYRCLSCVFFPFPVSFVLTLLASYWLLICGGNMEDRRGKRRIDSLKMY